MISKAMPVRPLDPIEEHVAVARLADGAGGHRAHALDAVAVDDAAELLERRERGVDGLASGSRRDENVSRPSSTPRDASSMVRIDRFGAISATTRRIALAPMSSTATSSGVVASFGVFDLLRFAHARKHTR